MKKNNIVNTDTPLFDNDYVILHNNGDFHSFVDGEIIIYGDKEEAKRDCLEFSSSKVVSCTALARRNRKALRKNIRKFSELPF